FESTPYSFSSSLILLCSPVEAWPTTSSSKVISLRLTLPLLSSGKLKSCISSPRSASYWLSVSFLALTTCFACAAEARLILGCTPMAAAPSELAASSIAARPIAKIFCFIVSLSSQFLLYREQFLFPLYHLSLLPLFSVTL